MLYRHLSSLPIRLDSFDGNRRLFIEDWLRLDALGSGLHSACHWDFRYAAARLKHPSDPSELSYFRSIVGVSVIQRSGHHFGSAITCGFLSPPLLPTQATVC